MANPEHLKLIKLDTPDGGYSQKNGVRLSLLNNKLLINLYNEKIKPEKEENLTELSKTAKTKLYKWLSTIPDQQRKELYKNGKLIDLSSHDFGFVIGILGDVVENPDSVNLSEIYCPDFNFAWADLSGNVLHKSVFSGTDLSGANLSGVDLNGSDFSAADLKGADLSGTVLENINLCNAKHLESITKYNGIYFYPSTKISKNAPDWMHDLETEASREGAVYARWEAGKNGKKGRAIAYCKQKETSKEAPMTPPSITYNQIKTQPSSETAEGTEQPPVAIDNPTISPIHHPS